MLEALISLIPKISHSHIDQGWVQNLSLKLTLDLMYRVLTDCHFVMSTLARHNFHVCAIVAITLILGAILNLNSGKSQRVLQSIDDIHPSLKSDSAGSNLALSDSKVTPDTLLKAAHDLEQAGAIDPTTLDIYIIADPRRCQGHTGFF
jgi:hypothetical protein